MQIEEICRRHPEYNDLIFKYELRELEKAKLITKVIDLHNSKYTSDKNDGNCWIAYWLELTTRRPTDEFSLVTNKSARVSIPDCDLDFEDDKREQIMEYITQTYGVDYTCQVVTFNHMKARASVRDVGRALGIPLHTVDLIAKSIKNTPGKPINLTNSIDKTSEYYSEDFDKYVTKDEVGRDIYKYAVQLENKTRQTGIHAAAMLIGDVPLVERIPLMASKSAKTRYVSQLDYPTAESIGTLKVDLLGLITLRIIRETTKLIKERHGIDLNINTIPYEDPSSYKIIQEGNTIGIFQVENSGMTRYLVQMRPTHFGHIADMISLYRPGPISYIPTYIARMKGMENVTYKHKLLEEITSDTYGIMIYQEQVNQVLMSLGGYHAGDADKVRKSISKKNVGDIEKNRKIFVEGCGRTNGIDAATANQIYDDINEFALYGFNRAHAASYARLCLITAYLKANYPLEYACACLICEGNDNAKRVKYIQDATRNNIEVLPPQIGGTIDFSIQGKSILYGLKAIDGIGDSIAKQLAESSPVLVFEMKLKKNQLERLVQAGCFDVLGNRQQLLYGISELANYAKTVYKWKKIGQRLMFEPIMPQPKEKLDTYKTAMMEYEALGAWLVFHPLSVIDQRKRDSVSKTSDGELSPNLLLVVTKVETMTTRKGMKMYKFVGVDEYGAIEVIVGAKLSKTVDLKDGDIVHVSVNIDDDDSGHVGFASNLTMVKKNE